MKEKKGGAINLVDDYLQIGSSTPLQITGAITLSAWINLGSISTEKFIIGRGSPFGGGAPYALAIYGGTNMLYFDCTDPAGTRNNMISNTAFNQTNTWYHITGVWDGTTNTNGAKIYVNGILEKQQTFTISSLKNDYNFHIGRSALYFSYQFVGKMDEMRVYNRALSAAEVKALYEGTK